MKLRLAIVDAAYWLGWNVLWVLPEPVSRSLFSAIARVTWLMRTRGVRQLELNLSRLLGQAEHSADIRQLSRRGLSSYMRYYCETFLLARWSRQRIASHVVASNKEVVVRALADGGAILTLPHSGNWDMAGAWAAQQFGSLCTVAERLRPEGVFQRFLKMRQALGITLMPLRGEGGTYEYLRDHVNGGRLVALLGDRDVAGNGMGVEFAGHRAELPIGAALLAIDTGRPLITCSTWYDGDNLRIDFDDPIDFERASVQGRDRLRLAQQVTGQIAANFGQHLRRHPANWHQLQPVWPDLIAGDS